MPHTSGLASQGVVAACSAYSSCVGLLRSTAMLLCQLVHCFGQPLLYGAYFAVHAGIASLVSQSVIGLNCMLG